MNNQGWTRLDLLDDTCRQFCDSPHCCCGTPRHTQNHQAIQTWQNRYQKEMWWTLRIHTEQYCWYLIISPQLTFEIFFRPSLAMLLPMRVGSGVLWRVVPLLRWRKLGGILNIGQRWWRLKGMPGILWPKNAQKYFSSFKGIARCWLQKGTIHIGSPFTSLGVLDSLAVLEVTLPVTHILWPREVFKCIVPLPPGRFPL